ncbi:MAG: pilin glycosylation ligase domain-containing protein [Marinagarivorans sp.]|nr:pilin glycosylation ligase domain-containing protein [Marinagarivorans sp.]
MAAFLIPNHYLPWIAFHSELLAFLALPIAFAVVATGRCGVVRMGLLPIVIAVCSTIPLVQYSLGLIAYFGDALMYSLYLFAFLGAYLVGATKNENDLDWLRYFCWAIYCAGLISAYIAVVQWLRLEHSIFIADYGGGGRVGANLAQPNNLATLLLMSGVAAGYLCYRQYLKPWMFWCSLVLLLIGVCMTQSRTALVSAFFLYLTFNFIKPFSLQRKYTAH